MSIPVLNKPAPFFKGTALIGQDFKEISIDSYAEQYLVLLFYRSDFGALCSSEIQAFSHHYEKFYDLNTTVIGISTDSLYCHSEWINVLKLRGVLTKMQFPLLSDKTMEISANYGVLNSETGYAYRGMFILDRERLVRQISINDAPVARSVLDVLRVVQALQYVEKTGDSCPENWKPGQEGLLIDRIVFY